MVFEHRPFDGPLEWFVKVRNPFGSQGQVFMEPSFLSNELEFYMLALLTFMHAYRHGGRYLWLWWTTIAHGLMTECTSYWVEEIDNFWHSQSTFMFFGQREPFHIMCLYPGFVYTASVAVCRLGISEMTTSFAVALFTVLFDLPYDVVGIKLLWWTWDDEDSNIYDRMFYVPWTSYIFHMTFACSFDFILQRARRYFVGISGLYSNDEIQKMPFAQQRLAENWWGEFKCLVVTGLFSMPLGIVQFVPTYHWSRDVFGIHAEASCMLVGLTYGLVAFYGLQRSRPVDTKEVGEREEMRGDKRSGKGKWYLDEVYLAVCMHYLHYAILVIIADPGSKQVLGLHQPMGSPGGTGDEFDCMQQTSLTYPYPFTEGAFPSFLKGPLPNVTVSKRDYVCPYGENMDEPYLDFNCSNGRNQPWVPGNQWYWICGTPWNDPAGVTHVEYIICVWGICFIGFNAYTQALCYPRNVWEQIFVLREFPKYYKSGTPQKYLVKVLDDRIGADGTREYLVTRAREDGSGYESVWQKRDDLVLDCAGPIYGERGGLFGQLFDTYGGSTRDRLRTYDSLKHSEERLKLFEERNKRTPVNGIDYSGPVPRAAARHATRRRK